MALCRGLLREHGKLIINLTVEDICAMLQLPDEATDHNSVLTDYVDRMLMQLEPIGSNAQLQKCKYDRFWQCSDIASLANDVRSWG
jgi:hypothetical protein